MVGLVVLLFVAVVAFLSVEYRRSQDVKHKGTYLGILIGVLVSPLAWSVFALFIIRYWYTGSNLGPFM